MLQQGELITRFPVGRKQECVFTAKITDSAVAQIIEVVGSFPTGQQIVVVNADGLAGKLIGLSYQDIQTSLVTQKVHNRIILLGIQNHKAICLAAADQGAHGSDKFIVILAGDDGADHLTLVAELADSPDGLQVEGILIHLPLGRRKNNADHANALGLGTADRKVGFITQLHHGPAYTLFGFFTDRGVVVAYSGYRRGGYPGQRRNIFDRNSHCCIPLF